MSAFTEKLKARAKENIKTIALAEGEDVRTLKAAEIVLNEGYAKVILVGDPEKIKTVCDAEGINIGDTPIVNPLTSDKLKEYADKFYELRKAKGVTPEQALETMKDPSYFTVMMVKQDDADGMVSGACHSSADTIRPSLQILKTAPGTKLVSAFFLINVPDCEFGENGAFVFGDSGLNMNPTAEELSEIAVSSAKSFEQLVGTKAKVAMLSFSTYGSAKNELVDKVQEATRITKEKAPDMDVDGELQFDAAIVPSVAASKAPGSAVAGQANTLIFPDLNAGNIGYKIAQRLGKAEAFGPILQGIAKPVNDLSRGCVAEDIAGVVAITAIQAAASDK